MSYNLVRGGKRVRMSKPNTSIVNPHQKEKPNPNAGGGTDRGLTENAGRVPNPKPGDHA